MKSPLPERHSEDRHKGDPPFSSFIFDIFFPVGDHRFEELESRLEFEKGKKKQEAHAHSHAHAHAHARTHTHTQRQSVISWRKCARQSLSFWRVSIFCTGKENVKRMKELKKERDDKLRAMKKEAGSGSVALACSRIFDARKDCRMYRRRREGKSPRRSRPELRVPPELLESSQARDRADRQLQAHCEELRQELKEANRGTAALFHGLPSAVGPREADDRVAKCLADIRQAHDDSIESKQVPCFSRLLLDCAFLYRTLTS